MNADADKAEFAREEAVQGMTNLVKRADEVREAVALAIRSSDEISVSGDLLTRIIEDNIDSPDWCVQVKDTGTDAIYFVVISDDLDNASIIGSQSSFSGALSVSLTSHALIQYFFTRRTPVV